MRILMGCESKQTLAAGKVVKEVHQFQCIRTVHLLASLFYSSLSCCCCFFPFVFCTLWSLFFKIILVFLILILWLEMALLYNVSFVALYKVSNLCKSCTPSIDAVIVEGFAITVFSVTGTFSQQACCCCRKCENLSNPLEFYITKKG